MGYNPWGHRVGQTEQLHDFMTKKTLIHIYVILAIITHPIQILII